MFRCGSRRAMQRYLSNSAPPKWRERGVRLSGGGGDGGLDARNSRSLLSSRLSSVCWYPVRTARSATPSSQRNCAYLREETAIVAAISLSWWLWWWWWLRIFAECPSTRARTRLRAGGRKVTSTHRTLSKAGRAPLITSHTHKPIAKTFGMANVSDVCVLHCE